MIILKHKLENIFLITVAALSGLFLAFIVNKNMPLLKTNATTPAIYTDALPTPVPTEIPAPKESTASEISSDATKKVILKTIENKNQTSTATLYTQDGEGENLRIIFTKTLEKDKSITIPYNTWSPDNKYFFIQENTPSGPEIKVFNALGESFEDGEAYLGLTNLFRKKETGNNFKEATGWGSETLIIVNATPPDDNTRLTSYWFEVPSKAVIQLSTIFN